jgi:polysaccharide deacetylase family protein (PEP-CTERM system associated)
MTLLAFSVDVEDWYNGFFDKPDDIDRFPSRIGVGIEKILRLLSDFDSKATFFFLGCLARRDPKLVRSVAREGHEIGIHGDYHNPIWNLDAKEFREQIRRARRVVEDISGQAVDGFRAPFFSVDQHSLWALDVLEEENFRYDSSIFPIWNPRYGFPSAPRFPFIALRNGRLIEVPISTLSIGPITFPFSGGFYLRTVPFGLARAGFRHMKNRGAAGVLYMHPWELDPGQPVLDTGLVARLRHRIGLHRFHDRIKALLSEFKFYAIRTLVQDLETKGRLLPPPWS